MLFELPFTGFRVQIGTLGQDLIVVPDCFIEVPNESRHIFTEQEMRVSSHWKVRNVPYPSGISDHHFN
jgi:hypothetical protein